MVIGLLRGDTSYPQAWQTLKTRFPNLIWEMLGRK
jgi:hypothetical protein